MKRTQLIFARFMILLFFIVLGFEETTLKMIRISSNIIPTVLENSINSTLKIKSNKFGQKNYDIDYDVGKKKDDDIQFQMKRITRRNAREPKIWDQWGNWSTCSVTCGIGKIVRWRHCIGGNCSLGEKKAQLKTCTSAAC